MSSGSACRTAVQWATRAGRGRRRGNPRARTLDRELVGVGGGVDEAAAGEERGRRLGPVVCLEVEVVVDVGGPTAASVAAEATAGGKLASAALHGGAVVAAGVLFLISARNAASWAVKVSWFFCMVDSSSLTFASVAAL